MTWTELSLTRCLDVLYAGSVGRVALTTPLGPRIVPVNYAMHNADIIVRTSPDSELGRYGANALLAFEVDQVDYEHHHATTVVARGLGHVVGDPLQIEDIRRFGDPEPWAGGVRDLYLRITWDDLTGRRVGLETLAPDDRGRATVEVRMRPGSGDWEWRLFDRYGRLQMAGNEDTRAAAAQTADFWLARLEPKDTEGHD